jgi:hypothetical protein
MVTLLWASPCTGPLASRRTDWLYLEESQTHQRRGIGLSNLDEVISVAKETLGL